MDCRAVWEPPYSQEKKQMGELYAIKAALAKCETG